MSIIKSHDITLYGGTDRAIALRPLCDEHLPLLYKLNADPEVVYWADCGNAEVFSEKDIRGLYGYVSQNALCFLVEVDGRPVGDFWLQKMNIPEISAKYPNQDVRRIDATIGEKTMWGQGTGTAVLGMLIKFAFCYEHVDILYGITADYNIRSQRSLLKCGFVLADVIELGETGGRAKKEYYYVLKNRDYFKRQGIGADTEASGQSV